MVRYAISLVLGSTLLSTVAIGQPPPQPLPPSITGVPAPVVPVAAVSIQTPAARFQNPNAFPPETGQAVVSVQAGAEWLWRMNQSNGRFFPGLNPALRLPLESDSDLRQAYAALALAEAAKFTGDERYAARATQSVLALLALTRVEGDARVPALAADAENSVAFAALLCMAICELPSPEAKLLGEAEALSVYLRKPPLGETEADATKVGLSLRALVATYRFKPDAAKKEAIQKCMTAGSNSFKVHRSPAVAAAMIPGIADSYAVVAKDPAVAAMAFEMADALCADQYTRADARTMAWVGGFKLGTAEPGSDSIAAAGALCAAAKLTRQVPDLTRFVRYRKAAVEALAFSRSLQFSDENAEHFEKSFRARFLVGGTHLGPSDGTVRIDATGMLVSAQLAFLHSGAEARTE